MLTTCDLGETEYLCSVDSWQGAELQVVMHVQGVMDGVPASKDYSGGFACKLMHKDLGLASAAAQHCGAQVPMSAEAARLYKQVTTLCQLCLESQRCSCFVPVRDRYWKSALRTRARFLA